jgi:hypothetical protein
MRPSPITVRTAIACAAFALMAGAAAAAPKAVKATYNATMNGMGIGVITEHFEVERGAYRILSETKPVGLAVLVQRQPLRFASRGQVTREGLRPAHFEGRRSAADAPQVSAGFDWGNAQLELKHDGKSEAVPLAAGTQDRLSIMYQFMFMPLDKARVVEFSMTNGRKVDRYRYRATPDVELDTPLGRIRTLHLVKQREPGDTGTEVWLSAAHHNFPVKMLIVEKDGVRYEQLIQHLELRD